MEKRVEVLRDAGRFSDRLPIFGSREFLAAKSSEYGWFYDGEFLLPFAIDQRLCFRRLIFTTETVCLSAPLDPAKEHEFLNAVIGLCKGKDVPVDFVATAQANAVFRTAPADSEHLGWGSFVVDLSQPENAIFESFHEKHRYKVRKALRSGVTIATTRDIQVVQNCLKETMVRQGLLFYPSVAYLSRLQEALQDNMTCYVAMHESRVQGAAVIVHNQLGGYYYYGGSASSPIHGAMNLMHFEIMKDLKSRNIPFYDFMGARLVASGDTKIEGVQDFKSKFGSVLRRGYCFRTVIRPFKYRCFTLAVKTYFAAKGSRYQGDVIDQTRAYATKLARGISGAEAAQEEGS